MTKYMWTYLVMVKIKSSSPSELEYIIPKYGATTETFVVLKIVVATMAVGLQSSETICVFIFRSGPSFQQPDKKGPINIKVPHTSDHREWR